MSTRLTISIAMCTYNGERFLQEQLDSFLRQTRLPDELVVCDDGSRDRTVDILEGFAARSPFPVRIIINPYNLGFSKNFEKAISLCQGEVIFLSDQDDFWLPEKVEVFEKEFQERPQLGLLFSDAMIADNNLNPLGYSLWEFINFSKILRGQFHLGNAYFYFLNHSLMGATTAFRSRLRDMILPIPDYWPHDHWIALLFSIFSELNFYEKELILYRRHSSQCYGLTNGNYFKRLEINLNKGREYYLNQVMRWIHAWERISSHLDSLNCDRAIINALINKLRHLNKQSQLPAERWKRLPIIFSEFKLGRYHMYSDGWRSMIKDLLIIF